MLLVSHIAGGALSMAAVGAGLYAWARDKRYAYPITVSLSVLAGWQLVSGILLLLQGASAVRICVSGLLCLSVMAYMGWKLSFQPRLQKRPKHYHL